MRVDFYHVDAFEVANYEPIWRALRRLGADARLVGPPDGQNRATPGWFDYEAFVQVCRSRGLPFETEADPTAVGVTTQNTDIITPYRRPYIRLMYGPGMYPSAWGLSERAASQFDCILVHGPHYQRSFAAWKPADLVPVVGYPRYDEFFAGKIDLASVKQKHSLEASKPILLYLPTWAENSSFDQYFDRIAETQREFQVVVRPHHCTVRFEPQRMAHLRAAGVTISSDPFALPELIAAAELVVADARSCSLQEAIMCGRRALGLALNEQSDEPWIRSTGLGALAAFSYKPDDFSEMVSRVCQTPSDTVARHAWRDQYVSYCDGSAAERAAQAILTAIDKVATKSRTSVRLARPVSAPPQSKAPLVSVVLPTYNHLKFLPAAINSLLQQTFTNFELIIVNDGSTDGTPEYLAQLKDPRIRVIHQENQRLPGALNAGFKAARGQLFTWVSADNYAAPIFLEALVGALETHPEAGWAVSSFAWVDPDNRITGIHRDQDLSLPSLLKCNQGIASFLYRRECQQSVGDYDPSLEGAEDWDMWLRLVERWPAVYVSEILYYYRHHGDSMTQRMPERVRASSCEVFRRAQERCRGQFALDALYPAIAKCADRAAAETHACFDLGTRLLRSPFAPPQVAAIFLSAAFTNNRSAETLFNLTTALIKAGAWDQAASSLGELQKIQHPKIQQCLPTLMEVVRTRRPLTVQNPPLFDLDPASELLVQTRALRLTYSLTLVDAPSEKGELASKQFPARFERLVKQSGAGPRSHSQERAGEQAGPRLSVVVTTCDRPEALRQCLEGFARQTLAREAFEVVVVDDGSEESIQPIVENFQKRAQIRLVCQANGGLAAARNAGIAAARGAVIVPFEEDNMPHPDCLLEHDRFHKAHPALQDAMVGFMQWAPGLAVTAFMHYITEIDCRWWNFKNLREGQELPFGYLTGKCSSYKRALVREAGGFDPRFRFGYEDTEAELRMRRLGLRVILHPRAVNYATQSVTYDQFCRRCYKQGQSLAVFTKLHAGDPLAQSYVGQRSPRSMVEVLEPKMPQITAVVTKTLADAGNGSEYFAKAGQANCQSLAHLLTTSFEYWLNRGMLEAPNQQAKPQTAEVELLGYCG